MFNELKVPKTQLKAGIEIGKRIAEESALLATMAKELPNAIELEESVIGALLLTSGTAEVSEVFNTLPPAAFYHQKNAVVYTAMLEMELEGASHDLPSVVTRLRNTNRLGSDADPLLPTVGHIIGMAQHVASAANLLYHAEVVTEMYKQRQLLKIYNDGRAAIENRLHGSGESAANVMQAIDDITKDTETEKEYMFDDFTAQLSNKLRGDDKSNRVTSSLIRSNGDPFYIYTPQSLTVIAACPKNGKTALAISDAVFLLKKGLRVHFYSLEISEYELWSRVMAQVVYLLEPNSGVPFESITKGNLDSAQYKWVEEGKKEAKAFAGNLRIFRNTKHVEQIVSNTRAACLRNEKPDIVIIDQLSFVPLTDIKERYDIALGHISRSLKSMAKKYGTPAVLIAQINEKDTKGSVPKSFNIKNTGSLLEDADRVVIVHREEVYNEGNADIEGLAEVYIDRARNEMPCAASNVKYIGHAGLFLNRSLTATDKDPFEDYTPAPSPIITKPNRTFDSPPPPPPFDDVPF